MASQFGKLPPGAAPYAQTPTSPRGLYRSFGMPESLVSIHFPDKTKNPNKSNPWYWWVTPVHPNYFSFLFRAWVRRPDFPIIKILEIDSQEFVPTPEVGFHSIEQAIANWNPDTFGRFDEREQKLWDLVADLGDGQNKGLPKHKPQFDVVKGQPQGPGITAQVKAVVTRFKDNFNALATGYNNLAGGVGAGGFHYSGQPSRFNFPLPSGPPTTISLFDQQLSSFVQGPPYVGSPRYIGPVPSTAFFNINTFTTQAQAFGIAIGQLDPKRWNMSVFPPVEAKFIGNGRPSAKTNDYSGYGPNPFPLHGLEIM